MQQAANCPISNNAQTISQTREGAQYDDETSIHQQANTCRKGNQRASQLENLESTTGTVRVFMISFTTNRRRTDTHFEANNKEIL